MANEIITTLHPDQDPNTNLYPNIKKENIPNGSIDYEKLNEDVKNILSDINSIKPQVDTSSNILAKTTNQGVFVGSDTGKWYYYDENTTPKYNVGGDFISNISNAVYHDDTQLQDNNGDDFYPKINSNSIPNQSIGLDKLNNELCEISNNLLDIKLIDGTAIESEIASYNSNENKLVINGSPSSNQSILIYMNNGTLLSDFTTLLQSGTYYLKMSSGLLNYTFTISLKTVKNGTITNVFSKYSGNEWEFTLDEDTYFYRIEIIITSGNTYNFDGYIWLNKSISKDYQSPKTIFVNPSYLENRLNPIETSIDTLNQEINPSQKATILFIFDAPSYDNRATILQSNGFRGTFNFQFSESSGSYGFNDLKQLVMNGHDIGLYYGNNDNTPPSYNSNDWDTIITNALNRLGLRGIFKPYVYGCKGLKSNAKIEESCRKNDFIYISANSIQTGEETYTYPNIANNNASGGYLATFTMHQHTQTETISKIDEAVANNYILPLFCHKTDGSEGGISEAYFIAIVNYVKSLYDNGYVDVLTYRELYNKYNKEKGKNRDYNKEMCAIMQLFSANY